jgi:tetratricopeptide (TPR) repeat protein
MRSDPFEKLLWFLLAVCLAGFAYLATAAPRGEGPPESRGKRATEGEIAAQARVAFIQKLYAPVEELRRQGNLPGALLKLDELGRRYPGEAHGHLLQGEVLRDMGSGEEALASFVAAVKLNPAYLDRESPLSRREEVRTLVAQGLRGFGERARANPADRGARQALQNVYYLQSRLAGGCE